MNPRQREYVCKGLLASAGIINLMPLAGIAGAGALQRLYGIAVTDANLLLMLQHRALLLGMVGAALLIAVWRVQWRVAASVVAMLSMVSYVAIAITVGNYNEELQRVMMADGIAIVCVAIAFFCERNPGTRWKGWS